MPADAEEQQLTDLIAVVNRFTPEKPPEGDGSGKRTLAGLDAVKANADGKKNEFLPKPPEETAKPPPQDTWRQDYMPPT